MLNIRLLPTLPTRHYFSLRQSPTPVPSEDPVLCFDRRRPVSRRVHVILAASEPKVSPHHPIFNQQYGKERR